jgi:hypothetical protein
MLYSVSSQKTVFLIVTAVKTSNFTSIYTDLLSAKEAFIASKIPLNFPGIE